MNAAQRPTQPRTMIRREPSRVAPLCLHPTLVLGILTRCIRLVRVPVAALPRLEADDLIWVREAVLIPAKQPAPKHLSVIYPADGSRVGVRWPGGAARPGPGLFLADHMPRPASRITLVVDHYRTLRLMEVDDPAALAMGILPHPDGGWMNPIMHHGLAYAVSAAEFETPTLAYQAMWRLIYEAEIPWDGNSEVAEVGFGSIARNIDKLMPGLACEGAA